MRGVSYLLAFALGACGSDPRHGVGTDAALDATADAAHAQWPDAGPPLVEVETIFIANEIWYLTIVGDTLYWFDPGVPGIFKLVDAGPWPASGPPILVLAGTYGPGPFYADGVDIYAVRGDGEVVVAPEGGEPVVLTTVADAWFAWPEDDRVYVRALDDLYGGRLVSVPKSGGDVIEVVQWTEPVDWAGSDATYFYACGQGDTGVGIHRVPKSGGEFAPPLTGTGPGCLHDSMAVYYSLPEVLDLSIYRLPRDGGSATFLGKRRQELPGLTLAGDYLYAHGAAIHRMPNEGGSFVPITESWPPLYPGGLLVGATRLYWVEFGSDDQGSNDVILAIPR